jgi:hypothetical protein
MTGNQIRETLTDVGLAVEVPPVDDVAFRARVRSERRRRTTGRVLVASVAAAALVTGAGALLGLGGDQDRAVSPTNPGGTSTAGQLPETVWFVRDGRLTALDPSGGLHPLDIDVEGVVGWTAEHVYAVDTDSHLVVVEAWLAADGGFHHQREEPPVDTAVESVALSGDGRFVAWNADGKVTLRDNLGGQENTFAAGPNTYVAAVGADGVLVSEDGDLVLRSGQQTVHVPTVDGGYGWAAQLANGFVLVPDRDGRSRLYDVRPGRAELVATVDGAGELGPYGERVATLPQDPDTGGELGVWDGTVRPVTGLDGSADAVRWADETTLLVSAHLGTTSALYACDIDLRCGRLPVEGDISLTD